MATRVELAARAIYRDLMGEDYDEFPWDDRNTPTSEAEREARHFAKLVIAALGEEDYDRHTEEVLEAQADVQTGLGILRLERRDGADSPHLGYVEDRFAKALARLHRLLHERGRPMYQPARHPEVEGDL